MEHLCNSSWGCKNGTDVVKKRERDLISNNGMTHVNRKSHMTTLEGEVT